VPVIGAFLSPAFRVERGAEGNYLVFDNHCTHLGCPYHWEASEHKFICPCHGGQFDATGKVLGGPPPRPLDRYETKVENGTLYRRMLSESGRPVALTRQTCQGPSGDPGSPARRRRR